MTCEECTGLLIEHAHDELAPDQAGPVSRHLAECSSCALEFCRLRADLDGVAEVYSESPDAAVAARLRARVQAHVAPSFARRAVALLRKPVPVYGALAAAAVPLAIWVGLNTTNAGPGSQRPAPLNPVLIEDYDGNDLLRVDPSLL